MPKVFAIDPGPTQSAFVVWDGEFIREFDKVDNNILIDIIEVNAWCSHKFVIEQVRSYGMPVGEEVFDTVHWSGRFHQASNTHVDLMPRKDVKMHLCHTNRASDSNIIQALRDRFAYGVRNYGKGTKKEPGFFYGFSKDIWQAFALAVTYYDLKGE